MNLKIFFKLGKGKTEYPQTMSSHSQSEETFLAGVDKLAEKVNKTF